MVVVEVMGGATGIAPLIAEELWIWVGGLGAGTVVFALLGYAIGRKAG